MDYVQAQENAHSMQPNQNTDQPSFDASNNGTFYQDSNFSFNNQMHQDYYGGAYTQQYEQTEYYNEGYDNQCMDSSSQMWQDPSFSNQNNSNFQGHARGRGRGGGGWHRGRGRGDFEQGKKGGRGRGARGGSRGSWEQGRGGWERGRGGWERGKGSWEWSRGRGRGRGGWENGAGGYGHNEGCGDDYAPADGGQGWSRGRDEQRGRRGRGRAPVRGRGANRGRGNNMFHVQHRGHPEQENFTTDYYPPSETEKWDYETQSYDTVRSVSQTESIFFENHDSPSDAAHTNLTPHTKKADGEQNQEKGKEFGGDSGSEENKEKREEAEKEKAIKNLPPMHSKGLVSTLIKLGGTEIPEKSDPLSSSQPNKLEDEKETSVAPNPHIDAETLSQWGITPEMIEEAETEWVDGGPEEKNLMPEETGRRVENSQFSCKLCRIQTTSIGNFRDHLHGKTHKATYEAFKLGKQPPPPKSRSKVKTVVESDSIGKASIVEKLLHSSLEPILGLSFITEFQSSIGIMCVCNLCGVKFDRNIARSHVTGSKHRLHYMRDKKPDLYVHLRKFVGKKSQLSAYLDELSYDVEMEHGRGKPVIKIHKQETEEEEEDKEGVDKNLNINHEENAAGEGNESIEKDAVQNKEKPKDSNFLSFQDWVDEEAKKSKELLDARKRSPSPSEKEEKMEDPEYEHDWEAFVYHRRGGPRGKGWPARGRGREWFPPEHPYYHGPHPRLPPPLPPPPPFYPLPSVDPYRRPLPPPPPPPLSPLDRLPPQPYPLIRDRYLETEMRDMHRYDADPLLLGPRRNVPLDPDPLKRVRRPEVYLDPDPTKRILKSDLKFDLDPLKRFPPKLAASKPVVFDYGHGSDKKEITPKEQERTTVSQPRRKANDWEDDIQDILGSSSKKDPDSLALLSSSYSSPKQRRSPSLPKNSEKAGRALPFSRSYLEMSAHKFEGGDKSRTSKSDEMPSNPPSYKKDHPGMRKMHVSTSRRSRSPVASRYKRSRSPDMSKIRKSRSPDSSRLRKSRDFYYPRYKKSSSPEASRFIKSRSPNRPRYRKSRSPEVSKFKRSKSPPNSKRKLSRSPENSGKHLKMKDYSSIMPESYGRPERRSLEKDQKRAAATESIVTVQSSDDEEAERIADMLLEVTNSLISSEGQGESLENLLSQKLTGALAQLQSNKKEKVNRSRSEQSNSPTPVMSLRKSMDLQIPKEPAPSREKVAFSFAGSRGLSQLRQSALAEFVDEDSDGEFDHKV